MSWLEKTIENESHQKLVNNFIQFEFIQNLGFCSLLLNYLCQKVFTGISTKNNDPLLS